MTTSSSWCRGLGVCLALGLGAAGCNRVAAPAGGPASRPAAVSAGNGSTSWSRGPNPRPGVDTASVDMCSWNGELVFAVWADVQTSSGGSRQTAAGETYFGSFPAAAGTRVEYEGQTADGRTGKVQFHTKDGRTGAVAPLGTYDLADGSLFLVAVRSPRPRVAQLKRDIRKADAAAFQKLPDAEPEIGRFFGAGPPGPGG